MAFGALLAALAHAIMDAHLMLKIYVVVHNDPCSGISRAERESASPGLLHIFGVDSSGVDSLQIPIRLTRRKLN